MEIYNPTARKIGNDYDINFHAEPEPFRHKFLPGRIGTTDYTKACISWGLSVKKVTLKPEFNQEFEDLLTSEYGFPTATTYNIESIKHRIEVTRNCGEGGCAPFGACSNPCPMVAILIPEVKEETQQDIIDVFSEKLVWMFASHPDKHRIVEVASGVLFNTIKQGFSITRNK